MLGQLILTIDKAIKKVLNSKKIYYEKDPKRLVQILVGIVSAGLFAILGIYWILTRTNILKMIGLEQ